MRSTFGGGVYEVTRRANKKPIWAWMIKGHLAAQFSGELGPFLLEPRKRERCRVAFEEILPLMGNYHPSAEARIARERAERRLLAA